MAATARPRSTTARKRATAKRAAKFSAEKIKQEDLAVAGGVPDEG